MTPNLHAGHPEFHRWVDTLKELHALKSGGYGTGSDPFRNFTVIAFAKEQERWEYPVDRIEEKITRIRSLTEQGRFSELVEEFRDIGSIAGCCHAMLHDDHFAE